MDEADIEEEVNVPMLRYQELLRAVQVLMTQNAVMAGSEGACSLDDDLATTTTEDGSLDTILKQLEAEKRRMAVLGAAAAAAAAAGGAHVPAVRNACVPLAEPEEEFLVDDAASSAGNNTDADVPNVPTSENVTPSDDVFLGSGPDIDVIIMPTEMPTEELASSYGPGDDDDDESPPVSPLSPTTGSHPGTNHRDHGGGGRMMLEENNYNGMSVRRGLNHSTNHSLPPHEPPSPTTQVDVDITDHFAAVNSNGLARSRKWLDFRIAELETLDWQGDGGLAAMDTDLNTDYDMLEFADKYYNVQIATGYTGAISKTVNMVRRRSLTEVIPMQELLHYTKSSTITQSHVHLHDPENVTIACSIFKDICQYMKGAFREELAYLAIRGILSYGIERVELRDEIYCQLIRQTNGCRHAKHTIRAWVIMALAATSFSPSRTLLKYLLCYIRRHTEDDEPVVAEYAAFCIQHLSAPRKSTRRMPPSIIEIEAMQSLSPMMCRIHFLDGQTRGVGVEMNETAGDTLNKVQEKIDLKCLDGWALYESTPEHDRYVKESECIADIISDWEVKQRALATVGSPRKVPPVSGVQVHEYGKFIFCKRIFKPLPEIPNDPVEYHLLYAQAVHHNCQVDEYSIPATIAVQLAGLQAQVIHGDYDVTKANRYDDEEDYLCQRVIMAEEKDWKAAIANAHKKFGFGKSELEAKIRYLAIISHFPLYGCIKFFAHYRGFWQYGIEFVLAIGPNDIKFVSLQEKSILFEYKYDAIETIRIDSEDNMLTIQLKDTIVSQQKSYMFECYDVEDMSFLLQAYSKRHYTGEQVLQQQTAQKLWKPSDADWLKMYDDILAVRRLLVTSGVVTRPPEQGIGLIKSAFKKLSGRACGMERTDDDVDVKSAYWQYSKLPFRTSIMPFESHDMEDVAIRIFNSTLVYTGLESVAVLEDIDLVGVVQTLLTKCMESDDICNEFYLQLIKQTTDTPPEPTNRPALRYWHLMLMATSVMLPPNQLIVRYLNLHLRKHALITHTEEGKCAKFCLKSLYRTYANKGRKFPPSYKEVVCVTKWNDIGHEILDPMNMSHQEYSRCSCGRSQPITVLLHLADGQQIPVEYDSVSTASEVMDQVKARIGMNLDAEGYGIFESSAGGWEQYIKPEEKLADCLYRWEQWAKENNCSMKELRYLFKKRIFVAPFMNTSDPIEIDLLYHQSVTDVFEGKIHVTKADAIRLCALRAQTEYSDYGFANQLDYTSVMRILPRHLRELINIADIQAIHKTLNGISPVGANIAFLENLRHWPLYGASYYEVTPTSSDSLPRTVWLAVSQLGIHLMEHRGQTVYNSYAYREISQCTPSSKTVVISLANLRSPKLILTPSSSTAAAEIVDLINDYKEIMLCRSDSTTNNGSDLPSKSELSPAELPTSTEESSTTNNCNLNLITTTVEVDQTNL